MALMETQLTSWTEQVTNISQNSYFDQGHCLFKFLNSGYCNSEILNTPSYLDLGGALAAFGLIFTVYQLRNPRWDTVLRIRPMWQRYLFWGLGIAGLVVMLARVLMTQVPINYLSYPFNIPLSYEILAYIFFALSPLSLWFFAKRAKGLFTAKTSRRFYEVLISEVSRSDDKWTDAALEVLLYNFEDVCKAVKNGDRENEVSQDARAIIDVVLSEETVVKILTTKRLDGLQHILYMIQKYNINHNQCDVGIPALMRSLFLDENSFFYKHLSRDGLSLSSNIYRSIFDSPTLLNNFSIFGYPTLGYSSRKNSRIGNQVLTEALSRAISIYIKTGQGSVRHINEGFEYLSHTFDNLSRKLSVEKSRGVDTAYSMEDEWWTLHDIADFVGHTYPFLDYRETLNQSVIDKEKTTAEASFHSDSTINAGVSALLYKSIEGLSHTDENDHMYWMTLHQVTHGMIYEAAYKEGYRAPFLKRIWQQIGANVVNRHYPAVLRPYLAFIGFYLPNTDKKTEGWLGEEIERMRRLLYVDLKPLLDADTEMVNKEKMKDALLPIFVDYHDDKFFYKYEFGKGEEKEIPPPVEGATSALAGVDLEHRSLL